MATKPTIVFIPGSFSGSHFYEDSIKQPLLSKGYDIEILDYPSIGEKEGLPTMLDDAAYIAAAVTKVADQGKDVVLVAHSYGGIPTSESIKGLSKADRRKAGKQGGVVRVAYMTALVPAVGVSAGAMVAEQLGAAQYISVQENGWMVQSDYETGAKIVFSDLPLERGIEMIKRFSKHSSASFATELTYGGYKDVPVSYLFCEADKCVPPSIQQAGIDAIEKASGNKVDVTKINHDHCPNLSAPEKTIDWIVGCVEKSV